MEVREGFRKSSGEKRSSRIYRRDDGPNIVYLSPERIDLILEVRIESKELVLNLSESLQFSGAGPGNVLNDVGWVAEVRNALEEHRK